MDSFRSVFVKGLIWGALLNLAPRVRCEVARGLVIKRTLRMKRLDMEALSAQVSRRQFPKRQVSTKQSPVKQVVLKIPTNLPTADNNYEEILAVNVIRRSSQCSNSLSKD